MPKNTIGSGSSFFFFFSFLPDGGAIPVGPCRFAGAGCSGVALRIGDLHLQSVLLPDGRIGKPVVNGRAAFRLLHKIPGTVFRGEIDGDRHRYGVQLRIETQRKIFLVRAFGLYHILAFEFLLEQAEFDVVREETGVTDRPDRIDRQAVFPGRILPGRQFEGRDDDGIQESDVFAGLVEFIVAVHIV